MQLFYRNKAIYIKIFTHVLNIDEMSTTYYCVWFFPNNSLWYHHIDLK